MKSSKKSTVNGAKKQPVKKAKPVPVPPAHPRYCALPKTPPRTFGPDVGPRRAEIILISSNKWMMIVEQLQMQKSG